MSDDKTADVADDLVMNEEESAALEAMKNEDAEPQPVADVPEPSAEPVPEPQPVAAEAPKSEDKPPEGYVPHQAMHAERMRRQEAEARVAEALDRLAALEARVPPPEPESVPDSLSDPDGYNAWVKRQAETVAERVERIEQEAAARMELERVTATLAASEREFTAGKPEYAEAKQHVIAARHRSLKRMYPGETDAAIAAHVRNEELQLAQHAAANGMSPAELIYQVATEDYGFRPAAPQANNADRIQAQARAQSATESLATASAAAGRPEITVESLAKMSEGQLAKIKAERPDEFRRALGG